MGGKREKSNIAIAILEKLPFLKGNKLFRILMVAIIFSPTLYGKSNLLFLYIKALEKPKNVW